MNRFLAGVFFGSLVPAVAIYLAGGSRAACAVIGLLIPLAFALKFPRKIGRALLWIAGERSTKPILRAKARKAKRAPRAKAIKGYAIVETPDGFTVPALDADSVFDTAKDAARFIRGVA